MSSLSFSAACSEGGNEDSSTSTVHSNNSTGPPRIANPGATLSSVSSSSETATSSLASFDSLGDRVISQPHHPTSFFCGPSTAVPTASTFAFVTSANSQAQTISPFGPRSTTDLTSVTTPASAFTPATTQPSLSWDSNQTQTTSVLGQRSTPAPAPLATSASIYNPPTAPNTFFTGLSAASDTSQQFGQFGRTATQQAHAVGRLFGTQAASSNATSPPYHGMFRDNRATQGRVTSLFSTPAVPQVQQSSIFGAATNAASQAASAFPSFHQTLARQASSSLSSNSLASSSSPSSSSSIDVLETENTTPFPALTNRKISRLILCSRNMSDINLKLLKSGKYSDLTIASEDREWKVHKAIVCDRCPFLAACVETDFKEARTGKINLLDDNPDIIELLLRYLYSFDLAATLSVIEDVHLYKTIFELYDVADKYLLKELKIDLEAQVKQIMAPRAIQFVQTDAMFTRDPNAAKYFLDNEGKLIKPAYSRETPGIDKVRQIIVSQMKGELLVDLMKLSDMLELIQEFPLLAIDLINASSRREVELVERAGHSLHQRGIDFSRAVLRAEGRYSQEVNATSIFGHAGGAGPGTS